MLANYVYLHEVMMYNDTGTGCNTLLRIDSSNARHFSLLMFSFSCYFYFQ